MNCIYIKAADGAFPQIFCIETADSTGAWYELDGAEAVSQEAALFLNADREVYAVYDCGGEKRYGTIGDSENDRESDNAPFSSGETYLFYEKPETKDFYI